MATCWLSAAVQQRWCTILDCEAYAREFLKYRSATSGPQQFLLFPVLENLLDVSDNQNVIVDIGCGAGDFLAYLDKSKKRTSIGIDINKTLLQEAASRLSYANTWVLADVAVSIPLACESVCRAVISMVLVHLDTAAMSRFAEELHRVLAEKAKAVIAVTHYSWAKDHYQGRVLASGELQAVRELGAIRIPEWHRPSEHYLEYFGKVGLEVAEHVIDVPELSQLEERYRIHTGKPIFNVFSVQKP